MDDEDDEDEEGEDDEDDEDEEESGGKDERNGTDTAKAVLDHAGLSIRASLPRCITSRTLHASEGGAGTAGTRGSTARSRGICNTAAE